MTKGCVSYGHYDWSKANLVDFGTDESVIMWIFVALTAAKMTHVLLFAKKSSFWKWYEDKFTTKKGRLINLKVIAAVRVFI